MFKRAINLLIGFLVVASVAVGANIFATRTVEVDKAGHMLTYVTDGTDIYATQGTADGYSGNVIYDEDGNAGEIDNSTGSFQIVAYAHHEIHSGSHYNYCDYTLNEGSGNTVEFVVTTPDTTKWTHLIIEAYSSEGATIELFEGTSGITGGTVIIPRNNNRNSTNTSVLTFVKDPASITTDGTRASGYLAGGGRTAGFVNREYEFILKQNETYLVRITSLAVSNDISWCAEWYEHTNRS